MTTLTRTIATVVTFVAVTMLLLLALAPLGIGTIELLIIAAVSAAFSFFAIGLVAKRRSSNRVTTPVREQSPEGTRH